MPNVFDQFDAAPPGVAPAAPELPTPPSGNVFDQFNAAPPGVAPVPSQPQQTKLPQPWTLTEALKPYYSQIPGMIKEGAPSLYRNVYENTMLGAEQAATPHPEQYGEPVSKDLYTNDAGEIAFKDAEGNLVPTDAKQHVVLEGPEGKAVYQRSAATTEQPAIGVARVLSLGLGANAPTTAAAPRAVLSARPATEATIPKLREAATAVYESPQVARTNFNPEALGAAFREVAPTLERMDPRVIQRIQGELNNLGPTVNDLSIASERLGKIAAETQGPLGQQTATTDAKAAQIVKQQIEKVIRQTAPEMATADQDYAAMKAAQTIVGRGDVARVKARGGDFAEKLAQQATTLLANPKYARGFTPDELTQLRQISEGSLQGERLRSAAGWLTGKIAQLGVLGMGAVGYQHSGLLGAIAGGIGSAAVEGAINTFLTRMGNRMTENQINALSSAIRGRSPLAGKLAQDATDWDQAWQAVKASPNSVARTNFARASRELTNSLQAVGVEVRPQQLMLGGKAGEDQQ